MAAANARRKYRAVLLGEPGVGKSTLFATVLSLKMTAGRQDESGSRIQTPHREGQKMEVNYSIDVGDTGVMFCLCDTGGVERFRTITRNYYVGSAVNILIYNSHRKGTLDGLASYVRDGNETVPDATKVLVGNVYGAQDPGGQAVEAADVDKFAKEHFISDNLRFELSINVEEDVKQLFQTIAEHLVGGGLRPSTNEINLSGSGAIDPASCCLCC